MLLAQQNLFAQKAPLPAEELKLRAEAIVVGEITDLETRLVPSRLEGGFGNFDWLVTLTITVSEVEVGDLRANPINARCIRSGVRKSLTERIGLIGHAPIPGTGTTARFYLTEVDNAWEVLMPNGIVAVSPDGDAVRADFVDAKEVTGLSTGYTYMLPLELWGVVVVGVVFGVFVNAMRKLKKGRAKSSQHLSY